MVENLTDEEKIIKILKGLWPKNKAKGLIAQAEFVKEVNRGSFGRDATEKFFDGCWLLAPKNNEFYKFRVCFFVHPEVLRDSQVPREPKQLFGRNYRPFHAIAEFLANAGMGIIYAVPVTDTGNLPLDEIRGGNFEHLKWKLFSFENGLLRERDAMEFFEKWEGNRGRASHGNEWSTDSKRNIKTLDKKELTVLLLNELFYSGLIKSVLKKPLNDPYDIDSFLVSISQKHVFPMEIKEKFPAPSRDGKFFGIDAGRVMMMLRMCVPNDANALYLIREFDDRGNFIEWKYITLSDMIMTASWNLQAGGLGMGGQTTQTIRLPYDYFKGFREANITEDALVKIGNLPKEAREKAREFGLELSRRFHR